MRVIFNLTSRDNERFCLQIRIGGAGNLTWLEHSALALYRVHLKKRLLLIPSNCKASKSIFGVRIVRFFESLISKYII